MRDALVTPLLDAALRGAVVLLVALVLPTLLHRRSAALRHAIWAGAIAAQLVLLGLAVWGPRWRIAAPEMVSALVPGSTVESVAAPSDSRPAPVTRVPGLAERGSVVTPTAWLPAPRAADAAPSTQAPQMATPARRTFSRTTILFMLWALGAAAVMLRLGVGTVIVARLARQGRRVDDGGWLSLAQRLASTLRIDRPLTLMRGDRLGVPVTWGIVYPVVLLPEDADAWPEERRRYVLVHEMAHVKRLDAFTQLVAQFALAIFWFNPLVWVAAQQMRRERENACDDYVITHGTKPSEYATDLLQLVQDIDTEGHRAAAPAFAALAMARRSEFEGRMLSILNPRIRRQGLTRKGVVMGLISTLIIAAPLAAFSPFSTTQSFQSPETATLPDSVRFVDSTGPLSSGSSVAQTPKSDSLTTESSGSSIDSCDKVGNFTGTSTSIHERNETPEDQTLRFIQRRPGRCVEGLLDGLVTFTGDERDIATLGRRARARFREVASGTDREVFITSVRGQLHREYSVNGNDAAFDDAARAWLASVIVTVVRESAYNAPDRVRRLEREGGANRVLGEIDAIVSSGAKRAYYAAFLELGTPLPDSTLTTILTRMKREFAGSSGDLRSVLQKIPTRSVRTAQGRTAFADAMASIESDGDKSALLAEKVPTADREMLIDIMDVAITIGSDGDKSRLLIISAATYLNPQDSELREAFFKVARTVESDGDMSRVLITAAPYGHADAAVTEAAINATARMESDGDIANVLTYIATQKLLTSSRIRDAYMAAARNIDSDGDRTRVLRAAMINQ